MNFADPTDLLKHVVDRRGVAGGSISRAEKVTIRTAGGERTLFVKTNRFDFLPNFIAEAKGLIRLADAAKSLDAIEIARPLAVGRLADGAALVLDWIDAESAVDDVLLADALSSLHRATLGDQIGLEEDNFLGATVQPNRATADWPTFFAQQRLGHQMRLAEQNGQLTQTLRRELTAIIDNIGSHWPHTATSLLHGDLWSGNMMQTSDRKIVLIDPAISHGPPEMELAMVRLFGGVGASFWDRYQQRIPLSAGWSHRVDLAMLYHLLNHLHLFGSGYLRQCETLASRLADADFCPR